MSISKKEEERLIRDIKNYFKDQWPKTQWKLIDNSLHEMSPYLQFKSKTGITILLIYKGSLDKCWGSIANFQSTLSDNDIPLSNNVKATDWEPAIDNALEQAVNVLERDTERSLKALKSLLESDHIRQARRR